jgi:membrane protein
MHRRTGDPDTETPAESPAQARSDGAAEKPTASPRREARTRGRGRHADKPSDMPKEGWLDILARTKQQIGEDNLSIVAAGVAFYWFVAIVPSLIVVIAIYGYIADPAQISSHIASLTQIVPDEAMPLLEEQLKRITAQPPGAGIGAIVGLVLALYGSAKATKALIEGLNIAYDEREQRGFLRLNALAIVLTVGAIVGAIVAVTLVAVLPAVLQRLHLGGATEMLLNVLRWPLLIGGFMLALSVVYRYGPSRHDAKWRWVSWGAVTAALLWLIGSGAFSLYVSKFASYDKTYGPLGTVVVFMLWLFISAFVVLIGAELNAEMERQTLKDTTRDPDEPIGERGAKAADTVGPTREELRPKKNK